MIVLQDVYQNAQGVRIEPGVYDDKAPELQGLGQYLVETAHAEHVPDPPEKPAGLSKAQQKAAEEAEKLLEQTPPATPSETPPTEENPAEPEEAGTGEPTSTETSPEPPAATGKGNKAKGKAEDKS